MKNCNYSIDLDSHSDIFPDNQIIMDIETFEEAQVRRKIVKKLCQYIIFILFILGLCVVSLYCIFLVIVSTKHLDINQESC